MLDERVVGELSPGGAPAPALAPRAWVEAHLERFAPAPAARPALEDVKALCELGLILLAVDDGWSRDVAAQVAPWVAAWEEEVGWRAVAERAGFQPRVVAVALPGLLWERLTGRASPRRAQLDAVVRAATAGRAEDVGLEVAFVRDLAGPGSCER
ncbi:MAG TPA: hypothetical protein VN238_21445, partial [Solirubrobacteraceae bacterium]|nr:hypothetical protein [Solirubrobacteraceae bacterium]